MPTLYESLHARGFIAQLSHPELATRLAGGMEDAVRGPEGGAAGGAPVTLYAGFDPSADSLHLGHLVPIMAMAHFQRAGHRVLAVVGGATGMIGDPSGRSDERNLLTAEQVQANTAALKDQLARFLHFKGDNAAVMLDNADWIGPMTVIDWLRDVGKYLTVNYMLAKDSVRSRIGAEQGISYTEFSYMTLQAYDFLHLYRSHGCALQVGGSDQWGNITAGIDMVRKAEGAEVMGMTCPLITTAGGQKFGKSAGNAVWLDAARTSPYQFYQYFVRTEDADVERFLKLFTFLELEDIEQLCRDHAQAPHRRQAQKRLAAEVTRLAHGEEGLARAEAATAALFGGDLAALGEKELMEIFADVPSATIDPACIDSGLPLPDLLTAAGACKSKAEARRMTTQGAISLNNRRITDPTTTITRDHLEGRSILIIRTGKKAYRLLRIAEQG